jgi:DNA-binding response OmpR family regulator
MMLSGKEESADKIKCFEMGADDYIVKPFNPRELIVRIKRRIESSVANSGSRNSQ